MWVSTSTLNTHGKCSCGDNELKDFELYLMIATLDVVVLARAKFASYVKGCAAQVWDSSYVDRFPES